MFKIKIREWNQDRTRKEVSVTGPGFARVNWVVPLDKYSHLKEKDWDKAITNWAEYKALDKVRAISAGPATVLKSVEAAPPVKTLAQFWTDDFSAKSLPKLQLKSRYIYTKKYEKYILPEFGKDKLTDITLKRIENFQSKLITTSVSYTGHDNRLTPQYINTITKLLSKILKVAVDYGELAKAPMIEHLSTATETKISSDKIYSQKQLEVIERVAYEMGLPFYTFIILSVDCGLRVGETAGLSYSSIDFDKNKIAIKDAVIMLPGVIELIKLPKAEKRRSVTMTDRVKRALQQMKFQTENKRGRVFQRTKTVQGGTAVSDRNGVDPNHLQYWTGVITKRAALIDDSITPNEHPHLFRHSCATNIAIKTKSAFAVKEQLGHSSIDTSMQYIESDHHNEIKKALDELGTDLIPLGLQLVKKGNSK